MSEEETRLDTKLAQFVYLHKVMSHRSFVKRMKWYYFTVESRSVLVKYLVFDTR